MRLLNVAKQEAVRTLGQVGGDARITDIALSSDGRLVAAATTNSVNIWKSDTTASPVSSINATGIEAIQFSPDSSEIAVAGDIRNSTKLFHAETGRARVSLKDPSTTRRAIRFSANGQRLVTPLGNSAVLWDNATGAALASYGPHDTDVVWSTFVQNDKFILTISTDGETKLWSVLTPPAGDAFHVACEHFRDTKALDQIAGAIGIAGLKPICSSGHEPMAFTGAP